MADAADVVAPAIDQKGNTVVWWVGGTIADTSAPGKVAVFDAATTFRITHDFTPDGFPLDSTQGKQSDERLALPDVLESLDSVQTTFGDGLTYMDTQAAAGHAAVVLAPVAPATSKSGYIVV